MVANNKVLLIEDDPFLLNMYATKLEMENFQVFTAEDGEKGLKLIAKEIPSVVLLDIILPGMDGYEVLKKIKADDKLKDIVVILLTNLGQKEDVDKGLSLGAKDFLIKAHTMPAEVVAKIKVVMAGQ